MDFAKQPWDFKGEAEGTGSADNGLDFARWHLEVGVYHLVFYPREDGTAIDAFYLTAPGAEPPTSETSPAAGGSTTCLDGSRTTPVMHPGVDLEHSSSDAAGWGRHSGPVGDPHAQAGTGIILLQFQERLRNNRLGVQLLLEMWCYLFLHFGIRFIKNDSMTNYLIDLGLSRNSFLHN